VLVHKKLFELICRKQVAFHLT